MVLFLIDLNKYQLDDSWMKILYNNNNKCLVLYLIVLHIIACASVRVCAYFCVRYGFNNRNTVAWKKHFFLKSTRLLLVKHAVYKLNHLDLHSINPVLERMWSIPWYRSVITRFSFFLLLLLCLSLSLSARHLKTLQNVEKMNEENRWTMSIRQTTPYQDTSMCHLIIGVSNKPIMLKLTLNRHFETIVVEVYRS